METIGQSSFFLWQNARVLWGLFDGLHNLHKFRSYLNILGSVFSFL